MRSSRCTWSSASTAVVGSLIAGDSAFSAMSTMMRNANIGSCSSVRSGPKATVERGAVVDRHCAAMKHEQRLLSATKSPTCGRNSITPSWRSRQRHQRGEVDGEHDFRCAPVLDFAAGRAGIFRAARLPPAAARSPGPDRRTRSSPCPRRRHARRRNRPQQACRVVDQEQEVGDARYAEYPGDRATSSCTVSSWRLSAPTANTSVNTNNPTL